MALKTISLNGKLLLTVIMSILLVLFMSASAFAEVNIQWDKDTVPYSGNENGNDLPVDSATLLYVRGTGLPAETEILFEQCTETVYNDTDIVETRCLPTPDGGFFTDIDGKLDATASVSYDFYASTDAEWNFCKGSVVAENPEYRCYVQAYSVGDNGIVYIQSLGLYFVSDDGGGDPEDPPTPTLTKDACMKNGWLNFVAGYGFKNQGACVSYVLRNL